MEVMPERGAATRDRCRVLWPAGRAALNLLLLYPVIVGRAVSLHALAILLVLAVGTVIAGLVGALLSVPLAAAAWSAMAPLTGDPDGQPDGTVPP